MSSTALDRPRPAKLWRAYPLSPNAGNAETATDRRPGHVAKTPLADVDSRGQSSLPPQVGMMFALLLAAFLAGWYVTDPRVSTVWARATSARRSAVTCEITWQGGDPTGRFQAVAASAGGRSRRVVAESIDVPWPPVDGRTPPTQELEAALGSLVASLEAAGWEPIASGDSWSQRRFVWRQAGETEPGSRASDRYAGAARRRGARGRRSEGRAARR